MHLVADQANWLGIIEEREDAFSSMARKKNTSKLKARISNLGGWKLLHLAKMLDLPLPQIQMEHQWQRKVMHPKTYNERVAGTQLLLTTYHKLRKRRLSIESLCGLCKYLLDNLTTKQLLLGKRPKKIRMRKGADF